MTEKNKLFKKLATIGAQEVESFYTYNPDLLLELSIGILRSAQGNDEVRASITVKDKEDSGIHGYSIACDIQKQPRQTLRHAIHKAYTRYTQEKNANSKA